MDSFTSESLRLTVEVIDALLTFAFWWCSGASPIGWRWCCSPIPCLERRQASRRLRAAIVNADHLIRWQALIAVIQQSYQDFSDFLSWLVIAPIYFAKEVDFGVFGQLYRQQR
ncbi:MAG: hypothetical protein ACK56F_25335, partial [bacterium]